MRTIEYRELQMLNFITSTINEMNFNEVIEEHLNNAHLHILWEKINEKLDEMTYRKTLPFYMDGRELSDVATCHSETIKEYIKKRAEEIAMMLITNAFEGFSDLREEDFNEQLERRVRHIIRDKYLYRFRDARKEVMDFIMSHYKSVSDTKRYQLEFAIN